MGIAFDKSRDALARIKRHRKNCLIIHYACQSLFDDKDNHSPQIANIVVKDYDNDQTTSFALHMMAEKLGINKVEIGGNFDKIEKVLLENFGDYPLHPPLDEQGNASLSAAATR